MYKLNLTGYVLIMVVTILFVMMMNQRRMKKDVEKSFDERLELFKVWEVNLNNSFCEEIAVMEDSIAYFKQLVNYNSNRALEANKRVRKLKSEYRALESQMEHIPTDVSGAFVTGLYEATDTMQYPLSGNQVSEIHLDLLEGIKMEDIIKELNFENHYLDESLRASGEMNVQMYKENELLDKIVKECQIGLYDAERGHKKLKRKLWRNRALVGVATVLGVIVLL